MNMCSDGKLRTRRRRSANICIIPPYIYSQVDFGLTHVCGIPGSVQNSTNNPSTWTLCPWRLQTGARSRSTTGATRRLSWTTLKRAVCCRWDGGNQPAARDADTGGFEVDPGDARWADINLEGTQTITLNHLWHKITQLKSW